MKKRYSNLDNLNNMKSFMELRQWRKERKTKQKDLTFNVPQADQKRIDYLQTNRTDTTLTWIGHSTFLIQMNGVNIVTDPVWAVRMGFDKRITAPGLGLDELPEIDVVLISHGHYDHLNFASIRKLPGQPIHLVPEGMAVLFERKRLAPVNELQWWQQFELKGVQFTFVPALHWTRRTPWDTNRSHWGGWVIQEADSASNAAHAIYFAGDSGYFRGFKEIGGRFPIKYALMPIGAYEPEWFMSAHHVAPEEAIEAFLDVKGEFFIPMHYGAYRLADDTPKEALDRLQSGWTAQRLDASKLLIMKLGETIVDAK